MRDASLGLLFPAAQPKEIPMSLPVRRSLRPTSVLLAIAGFASTLAFATAPPSSAVSAKPDRFPASVTSGTVKVSVARKPQRIVSISPTATEILFAVGAGKQVTAVDDQSNYPTGAPRTKLSGFQPNVEAIVAYKPDLVVMSQSDKVTDALRALKIPVLVQSAANQLEDTYTQMTQLGVLTGNSSGASLAVSRMKKQIRDAVAGAPKLALTYYHELDPTFYTVTSKTFIGSIYTMFGLKNIADGAPGAGSGYPQLNNEFIVKANPAVIFLADVKCCGQSATELAKRPGWNKLAALSQKNVVVLDDDVASRWGPRVPEQVKAVAAAMKAASVAAAA